MGWKNTIAGIILTGFGISAVALAVEPVSPKTDPVQTQTPQPPTSAPSPAVPKQHQQDGEVKPPLKSPTSSPEGNKEVGPSVIPGPAKPPSKATHPSNGNTPPKAATMPQPPAELVGRDGAPMVLIPAGEFTMRPVVVKTPPPMILLTRRQLAVNHPMVLMRTPERSTSEAFLLSGDSPTISADA